MKNKYESIYTRPKSAPWTYSKIPKEIKDWFRKKLLAKNASVLEVACGEGHQAIFLAEKGMNVLAIDYSKNAIKFAKQNAKKTGVKVTFKVMDYKKIKSLKKKFDFIFDWRFLMQLTNEKDREKYLKTISQLLKPKGKYLSVSFSGDSNFMGKGKIRISPVGIKIYFEKLNASKKRFKKYFKILKAKWIYVPQKPNLRIKTNYLLVEKNLVKI